MDIVAHGEEAYATGEGAILIAPEAGVEVPVPVADPGRECARRSRSVRGSLAPRALAARLGLLALGRRQRRPRRECGLVVDDDLGARAELGRVGRALARHQARDRRAEANADADLAEDGVEEHRDVLRAVHPALHDGPRGRALGVATRASRRSATADPRTRSAGRGRGRRPSCRRCPRARRSGRRSSSGRRRPRPARAWG